MAPEPPSRILYGFLLVATAINVLGLPFAVFAAEPLHATVHAGLALACGYWALRLRHRRLLGQAQAAGGGAPDQADEPRELEAGGSEALRDQWLRQQRSEKHQGFDE